ncbi:hypothetical protein DXT88_22150 [Herbaspirillum lusitanum]|uniref:hypothetical protein n=1 Tax=Herbaspirillum lusitanum TaxID=213312 RepID=UPI00223744CB|nr:hypothetical protein [Herbaspirillum lusitanum]MCW5300878.1 hypothetical protein [Herbaspirillum lusitanum]
MENPQHINNPLALPDSLRDLIECVGESAALRIVGWRGGAYLCVPKKVDPAHPLLEQIGAPAFSKLVDWYGGETLMLPKNDAVMRQIKHALIRQLRYEKNMQVDQIAIEVHYSMRRVFQVLAEDDPMPTTGDLF